MSKEALEALSDEELEELLQERRKKAKREEQARRKKYEQDREQLVRDLMQDAIGMESVLTDFKKMSFEKLEQFYTKMVNYGEVQGNSKGGFSLQSVDGNLKIRYKIHQNKSFDERAEMAEQKLRSFLESSIKSRSKKAYTVIVQLLERTKGGEFDVNLINRLYSMENDFDSPDWVEAIKLFKEAYNPNSTTRYVNFERRDKHGTWQTVQINFSSIKL